MVGPRSEPLGVSPSMNGWYLSGGSRGIVQAMGRCPPTLGGQQPMRSPSPAARTLHFDQPALGSRKLEQASGDPRPYSVAEVGRARRRGGRVAGYQWARGGRRTALGPAALVVEARATGSQADELQGHEVQQRLGHVVGAEPGATGMQHGPAKAGMGTSTFQPG